jgi:hypothetical protein
MGAISSGNRVRYAKTTLFDRECKATTEVIVYGLNLEERRKKALPESLFNGRKLRTTVGDNPLSVLPLHLERLGQPSIGRLGETEGHLCKLLYICHPLLDLRV